MIVVTGAFGFIGSALLAELQNIGYGSLVAVDDFSVESKKYTLENIKTLLRINREDFHFWLEKNQKEVQIVFHIGARTRTDEFNWDNLNLLNVHYTKKIWQLCTDYSIPLIYASSAATYGDGKLGFSDKHEMISGLKPLNPYGESKQQIDEWILQQSKTPPFWAGFKFFNVFGPNEYHKGRMASVVFHAFNQINETKKVKLFKSYNSKYTDGGQLRDFVYIKDVVSVLIYFMENRKHSGIYNLGSGTARTFEELAEGVFKALNIPSNIEFIDMPEDIRENYQYYTKAEMEKIIAAGYTRAFWSFKQAIYDYVINYLIKRERY